MASLGDLVVNLVADSSRMSAGLREGQAALNAFGAAAAAMATASVYRFVSVGDSFNDMATRTGIAVESLSALSYAAKLSDTSAEGLQSSLFKMAKFLDSVRGGSAEAAATLRGFGIETSHILAAAPEEQFAMFADAIRSIQDPSLRVAAAMKVFGKGAADIIPLLMEGSTGIGSMVREAESLGVVMSGETAAAAAETADAIDRLTVALDAAAVQVGSILAPAVKVLANAFAFLAGANRETIQVFAMMAFGIAAAVGAFKAVTLATQAYAKAQAIATALSGPKGWITLGLALGAATIAVNSLNGQFAEQNKQLEALQQNAPKAAAAVAQVGQGAGGGQSQLDVDVAALNAMRAEATKLQAESTEGQAAALQRRMQQLLNIGQVAQAYSGMSQADVKQAAQTIVQAASGYTDARKKLADELAVLRGETTAQEQELARMAASGVGSAQIDALRQMQAEREKLLKQQDAEREKEQALASAVEQRKRNEEAARDAMKSEAAAIIDSLKTPLQKAQEQVNKIQQLQKAGLLTQKQADAAISEIAKAEAERQTQGQGQPQQVQFASAMQRGSSAAFNTILAAMGRGQQDPNVKATEKQTQALIQALKQNKVTLEVAEAVA